jgi:TRAP transporter 4TM/12TM fusion protein
MVHFEAKKQGLAGLPRDQLPQLWLVVKERWLLLMPLIMIVWLLIGGSSPFLAAFWGIIYSVSIGQIHSRTYPLLVSVFLSLPCVLLWMNPLQYVSFFSVAWCAFLIVGFFYTYQRADLRSWLLGLIPVSILTVLLLMKVESSLCAFWTHMAIIAIGVTYNESRMRLPDILETLELGTKNALAIGAACACVGFIVGATTLTGLGLKFAAAVIELAHGVALFISAIDITHLLTLDSVTLFFTLVFTAVACFILGMGIPTTAQYIIASMIAAPALLKWGIHPLVSHMFVLFYAVLADVTPPVALAAYAASGISGGNPFKTGFTAFSLSMAKVYVPFAFVYSPIILWLPRLLDANASFDFIGFIHIFTSLVLGVIALGATIIGYLGHRLTLLERIVMGIATVGLFISELYANIVGFTLLISIFLTHIRRTKKEKKVR